MANSDEKFRAYFLGELTDEEAARLENDVLGDDANFTFLKSAENDLLDDYTNDRLSPIQTKLFEKNYLNTPFRQNRLDFSKTLSEYLQNEPKVGQVIEKQRFAWTGSFSFWKIGITFASLAIILSSGFWLVKTLNQPTQEEMVLSRTPEPQPTISLKSTPTISPIPTVEKTPIIEANKQVSLTPKPPISPTPTVEKTPSEPKTNQTVVLALSTVGLRDGGKTSQITLEKDTKNVLLRLNLGETSANRFEIKIQNSEETNIYQTKNVPPNGKFLTVNLPAKLLKNDDYTIEVSTVNTNKESEKIANYNFRVLQK